VICFANSCNFLIEALEFQVDDVSETLNELLDVSNLRPIRSRGVPFRLNKVLPFLRGVVVDQVDPVVVRPICDPQSDLATRVAYDLRYGIRGEREVGRVGGWRSSD